MKHAPFIWLHVLKIWQRCAKSSRNYYQIPRCLMVNALRAILKRRIKSCFSVNALGYRMKLFLSVNSVLIGLYAVSCGMRQSQRATAWVNG